MKAFKVSGPPDPGREKLPDGLPTVDARGRPCPWPIIELAKALKLHPEVELWADDPATGPDLESFCGATGARLKVLERSGALLKARVVR